MCDAAPQDKSWRMHGEMWNAARRMAKRVLLCVEDAGVGHVVAARLMQSSIEGVVVERVGLLAEAIKAGVDAVVVQDRYGSGDVGTSLLRQVRVAKQEIVPSLVLVTRELAPADRHVFERQYKVSTFLPLSSGPIAVAEAVKGLCGVEDLVAPVAVVDDDEQVDGTTTELSAAALRRLTAHTDTNEGVNIAELVGDDISQLPPPGGDNDFELSSSADAGEEDPVRIQELERTQQELRKALLAERKARETAQKKADELEARLAKLGDTPMTSSGALPSEGVFEDVRYPALLARCRAEGFTGAIVMQSGGATRTVHVRDGLPVAFTSSEPGERIGKVLVTQNRITDEQYMKAATRMVERSIKLTDALVELNLIDAETLANEQRNLSRDQIIQGFELVQGRFQVVAGQHPDAATPTFDFGPGEIYVQGFRRYAPANEMLALYETMRDVYLTPNARLGAFRPKLGLNSEDERLIRLLGEAFTVEEAVERAQLSVDVAARLLAALQALELVESWSPGVEQFRSRLRAERQRQAEDIAQMLAEAKRREDRLLKGFERALNKLGGGTIDVDGGDSKSDGGADQARAEAARAEAARLEAQRAADQARAEAQRAEQAKLDAQARADTARAEALRLEQAKADAARVTPSTTVVSSPPEPAREASRAEQAAPGPDANKAKADDKYRAGLDLTSAGRLDEAESTLREAVRLDASRPEYLTALARVLLGNPRYERAGTLPVVRALLDRAVQLPTHGAETADLHRQVVSEMG
jgi:hypothetical protein